MFYFAADLLTVPQASSQASHHLQLPSSTCITGCNNMSNYVFLPHAEACKLACFSQQLTFPTTWLTSFRRATPLPHGKPASRTPSPCSKTLAYFYIGFPPLCTTYNRLLDTPTAPSDRPAQASCFAPTSWHSYCMPSTQPLMTGCWPFLCVVPLHLHLQHSPTNSSNSPCSYTMLSFLAIKSHVEYIQGVGHFR